MSGHDRSGRQHAQSDGAGHGTQQSRTRTQSQQSQRRQPQRGTTARQSRSQATDSVPTGFRLVSALFAVTGLLSLGAGAVVFQTANTVATTVAPVGTALLAVGAVFGLFGLTNLAAGYGTWQFTGWGRTLGLFVAGSGALGGVLLIPPALPVGLVQLGVNGAVVWYLVTNSEQYARLGQTR